MSQLLEVSFWTHPSKNTSNWKDIPLKLWYNHHQLTSYSVSIDKTCCFSFFCSPRAGCKMHELLLLQKCQQRAGGVITLCTPAYFLLLLHFFKTFSPLLISVPCPPSLSLLILKLSKKSGQYICDPAPTEWVRQELRSSLPLSFMPQITSLLWVQIKKGKRWIRKKETWRYVCALGGGKVEHGHIISSIITQLHVCICNRWASSSCEWRHFLAMPDPPAPKKKKTDRGKSGWHDSHIPVKKKKKTKTKSTMVDLCGPVQIC